MNCLFSHLSEQFQLVFLELLGGFRVKLGIGKILEALFYQESVDAHVLTAVEQYAFGGLSVSSGSSGFLIVALHVLGHIVMHDK